MLDIHSFQTDMFLLNWLTVFFYNFLIFHNFFIILFFYNICCNFKTIHNFFFWLGYFIFKLSWFLTIFKFRFPFCETLFCAFCFFYFPCCRLLNSYMFLFSMRRALSFFHQIHHSQQLQDVPVS